MISPFMVHAICLMWHLHITLIKEEINRKNKKGGTKILYYIKAFLYRAYSCVILAWWSMLLTNAYYCVCIYTDLDIPNKIMHLELYTRLLIYQLAQLILWRAPEEEYKRHSNVLEKDDVSFPELVVFWFIGINIMELYFIGGFHKHFNACLFLIFTTIIWVLLERNEEYLHDTEEKIRKWLKQHGMSLLEIILLFFSVS